MAHILYIIETGTVDDGEWIAGSFAQAMYGYEAAPDVAAIRAIPNSYGYKPRDGSYVRVLRDGDEIDRMKIVTAENDESPAAG